MDLFQAGLVNAEKTRGDMTLSSFDFSARPLDIESENGSIIVIFFSTGTWTQLKAGNAPIPRYSHTLVLAGGKFLCLLVNRYPHFDLCR